MDIWFVSTELNDKTDSKLTSLEVKDGAKCCWTSKTPEESLSNLFTGFARIIKYADYSHKGDVPEYAFMIYEG